MDHDWRDIENTVWVQDVPRRPSPIPHQPKSDDFPSTLESVLYAINVTPAIASLVSTGVGRPRAFKPSCGLIWCSSSTQISRLILFVLVYFARAGTSPA